MACNVFVCEKSYNIAKVFVLINHMEASKGFRGVPI